MISYLADMTPLAVTKQKWFWYSILCVACWGPWALFAKLGSEEIPPKAMQFLFTLGCIPVGFLCLVSRRFRIERSVLGISYGLLVGVLSAAGQLALFAAYRAGNNTTVITVMTGLYPMVTVLLAVTLLRERLTRLQITGLGFAGIALVIFSL